MTHSPLTVDEITSDIRHAAEHMRRFGLAVLGRAVHSATFSDMGAPFVHAMAVLGAAHGAEIVLKARIAEEHPLLIFEKIPTKKKAQGHLALEHLLEHGVSIMYSDLPERLWAATGIRMGNEADFFEFGRLRNVIQHFAVPNRPLSDEVLRFVFNVVEPLINQFWNESAAYAAVEWDEAIVEDGYLGERLKELGVTSGKFVREVIEVFESQNSDSP